LPELPDVEFARSRLQSWLAGATVTAAACTDPRIARPALPRAFAKALVGRRFDGVVRKGKWLRLDTDGGHVFSHLGMTGDWVRVDVDAEERRFERARIDVLRLGRKASVRYIDARRFGRLVVAGEDIPEWTELGPDPLGDGLSTRHLSEAFAKSRRAVKETLMDQRVLAGVGNILATEAMWMARLDPRSRGSALAPAETRAIAKGVRRVIALELAERKKYGEAPLDRFFVYGRRGQPCPRCGTTLSAVVLAGRTTAFCSGCQLRR
jgi:formamidopyrimidine-DNA glycosylase